MDLTSHKYYYEDSGRTSRLMSSCIGLWSQQEMRKSSHGKHAYHLDYGTPIGLVDSNFVSVLLSLFFFASSLDVQIQFCILSISL